MSNKILGIWHVQDLIESDIKTLKESVDGVGWVGKGSCVSCQLNLRPIVSCQFESHPDPLKVQESFYSAAILSSNCVSVGLADVCSSPSIESLSFFFNIALA